MFLLQILLWVPSPTLPFGIISCKKSNIQIQNFHDDFFEDSIFRGP